MTDRDSDAIDLDRMFHAARSETEQMPQDLTDRILADARMVQVDLLAKPPRRAAPGIWQQMLGMLGGWPAVGGLAAACAAGVWLGVAPPHYLPDPMQLVQQSETALFDDDNLVFAMSEEG